MEDGACSGRTRQMTKLDAVRLASLANKLV